MHEKQTIRNKYISKVHNVCLIGLSIAKWMKLCKAVSLIYESGHVSLQINNSVGNVMLCIRLNAETRIKNI